MFVKTGVVCKYLIFFSGPIFLKFVHNIQNKRRKNTFYVYVTFSVQALVFPENIIFNYMNL